MHLDRDIDLVIGGQSRDLTPVVDGPLPLVLERGGVFGWPRGRDPVWHLVVRPAGRESREAGDGPDLELGGQSDRLAEFGVGLLGPLVVGMERIVVGRERADPHVVLFEQIAECRLFALVVEVCGPLEVVLSRMPPTPGSIAPTPSPSR